MKRITPWHITVLTLATTLAVSACGGKDAAQQQTSPQAQHAPTVHVVTVHTQDVLLEMDLPGRLEAVRSAVIVPQVTGIVKHRLFQEGAFVRAGQPLYQLDDASYMANLESARASLLSAQATLAKADADVARYRPLVQADAISQQDWDAAVEAKRAAEAAVKSAQAAIKSAQVNVQHARIVAPISGVIGQSSVTEGALVAANTTQMATIRQNDPLYVNIKQSASELLKLHQQLVSGERVLNDGVEVSVELEDGTAYPYKGRLMFTDATVDEKTGQVNLRAAVPNPNGALMNGLYVRVKLPLAGVLNAFVVPQQAVTRGKQDMLMIVNEKGAMEPRVVKITGQKGNNWVISEGLKNGDKVIVDGTMVAGMTGAKTVQPKEWQPEKSDSASAPNIQAASPVASAAAH